MTTSNPVGDVSRARCDGSEHPPTAIPPLPFHAWRFDGDDPYIVCTRCGERRDAITGRTLS